MILVPNLISLSRLLSVPVAVWLIIAGHTTVAFWLFVAAGLSDALDGFIAKRYGARTVLGGFLDPLADKALLVSVYVTLGYEGHIQLWLVILIVFRDVLIIGGALLYQTLTQALRMEPLAISKINTAAQIGLAALLLARLGLGFEDHGATEILVHVVAATTLLSGAAYVIKWGVRAARMEGRG
jgi:cardiolipin synthase (CMP-forming)